jgi:hypothetical protein
MNSYIRIERYLTKKPFGYTMYRNWRSRVRLAFQKANIFPMPKLDFVYGGFHDYRSSFGLNPKSKRRTLHMRKKDAIRLLADLIKYEAAEAMSLTKSNIVDVIWRHTGGHSCFAKYFLVSVREPLGLDASGKVYYKSFLALRTRMAPPDRPGRGRYIVIDNKTDEKAQLYKRAIDDDMLAHLPDHLFESAVDALAQYNETGYCSWFPESRDEEIRNFHRKYG